MRDALVGGPLVVELDDVGGEAGYRAREQHHRNAGFRERVLQLLRQPAGRLGENDAVDPFGQEQAQVDLFLLQIVVAARDQQRVAAGVGRVFGAADDFGKKRVGDVGDDHADRLRALLRHAARQQIRLVAERGHGGLDAAFQIGADERAVVQHRRDGGDRHAGAFGDVVNVRHDALLRRGAGVRRGGRSF
jgi:hypothetical protein